MAKKSKAKERIFVSFERVEKDRKVKFDRENLIFTIGEKRYVVVGTDFEKNEYMAERI
jgi:hypothetical protein